MPAIKWNSATGSLQRSLYRSVSGIKNKPFKPIRGKITPPSNYALSEIAMVEAELGSFGRPCGTAFPGEISPLPLVNPNRDATGPAITTYGNLPYARAYAKFKDKVYTQAANLTALRERVKTVDMILNRLVQLHKGAKALKRGRFKEFCSVFSVTPKEKHKKTKWTKPKQFGALWLEYWMGWAPTVGDIYNSVDAYQGEIPEETIRAGSSHAYSDSKRTNHSGAMIRSSWSAQGTIWIQGTVEVTNPSLHKAQALGLVNPLLTVWETTPFSWFFGWFNTLSQTLGQFTDWVGLKLKNLVVSSKTEATCSWSCGDARLVFGQSYPPLMYHVKERFWFSRNTVSGALPPIKPAWRLPNGLSLTRGATLASLLVTIFAPGRK